MEPIQYINDQLNTPKKIFITAHHKPDGDAIGSTLGLYHYLLKKGHFPTVVMPSETPEFLNWMPGVDTILNYEATPDQCLKVLEDADIIYCLDFNNLNRVKTMEAALTNATQPRVLIDHHLNPQEHVFYCGTSISSKSSTCEMVYDYIIEQGDTNLVDTNIATCLYTGTMTDTGSFRFPITTASVHKMIAHFKDIGLEHAPIHQEVFDSWGINRMKFLGFVLQNRMEFVANDQISIIALSSKDMRPFALGSGDTEGVVNYPMSVKTVKVAILITEKNGEVKMSFRSKGDVNVSAFASQYFNGGGHFNAAGGRSDHKFEETVIYLKKLIEEQQLIKF